MMDVLLGLTAQGSGVPHEPGNSSCSRLTVCQNMLRHTILCHCFPVLQSQIYLMVYRTRFLHDFRARLAEAAFLNMLFYVSCGAVFVKNL